MLKNTVVTDAKAFHVAVGLRHASPVLVLMLDKHLGNVVVALQVIRTMQESYADRRVYLVFNDIHRELIESALGTDSRIIFYPRAQMETGSIVLRSKQFIEFANRLRRLSAAVTIDLVGNSVSAILSRWSRAGYRIAPESTKYPYVYTQTVHCMHGRHRVFAYADLFHAVGEKISPKTYRLRSTEQDKANLNALLQDQGITGERPIVCLHPGAGKRYKQWSWRGFAHVASWLAASDYDVVFIGIGDDGNLIDTICNHIPNRVYNLSSCLSLGELTELLRRSVLFIGNDSGPMHLAAATGAPVVALYGPTDEKQWGPLSDNVWIVRGDEACAANCRRGNCSHDFRCLRSITPELVKGVIRKALPIADEDKGQLFYRGAQLSAKWSGLTTSP